MAEYRLPHEIYYETAEPVSISDVIESLLGTQAILKDMGPLIEACIPGITIERIEVSVKEISEGSLKEVVWASIFLTFQKDLEAEVPNLLDAVLGVKMGQEYPTITTVFFLVLLFYGADFAYQKLTKVVGGNLIKQQLDGLVTELAGHFKIPEERLRLLLADRYAKGRMRPLVQAAMRVFRPSKQHSNSAVRISGRRIEPRIVAEVPGDAQMLEYDPPPTMRALHDVDIELHAQDMDHTKQGWAAVIPSLSKQRVRLELMPPVRPVDIYTRSKIKGDVMVVFREAKNGEQEPAICHLTRISA